MQYTRSVANPVIPLSMVEECARRGEFQESKMMLIFRKKFHQISTSIRISRPKDGAKDCINGYVSVTYICSNSVNIPKGSKLEALPAIHVRHV